MELTRETRYPSRSELYNQLSRALDTAYRSLPSYCNSLQTGIRISTTDGKFEISLKGELDPNHAVIHEYSDEYMTWQEFEDLLKQGDEYAKDMHTLLKLILHKQASPEEEAKRRTFLDEMDNTL